MWEASGSKVDLGGDAVNPRSPARQRGVHDRGTSVPAMATVIPCVGAIVLDPDGRLLLIQRGTPPHAGTWSLPGGRVETGETGPVATAREVSEETGLRVSVGLLVGTVRRPGLGGAVYVIEDRMCAVLGGNLRAGDDAADARFVDSVELAELVLSPGLAEALTNWGILPLVGG